MVEEIDRVSRELFIAAIAADARRRVDPVGELVQRAPR